MKNFPTEEGSHKNKFFMNPNLKKAKRLTTNKRPRDLILRAYCESAARSSS